MKMKYRQTSKPDHITRQEFHEAIDATRNSLTDKLEATAKALALSFETCRSDFEHRLDRIENAIARLEERTRP